MESFIYITVKYYLLLKTGELHEKNHINGFGTIYGYIN